MKTHIPIHKWGKDHWQLLVDLMHNDEQRNGKLNRGFMRTHAHNALKGDSATRLSQYPTRLKNSQLDNHDDWDCLNDIMAEELANFATGYGPAQEEVVISLSERGWVLVSELLEHVNSGYPASSFITVPVESPIQAPVKNPVQAPV